MKAEQVIDHQCGLLGCRVGEVSHPGPVQTRSARRLERSTLIDSDGAPSSVPNSGADVVVEAALADRIPVEWDRVATRAIRQNKRLRLSQATTVAVPDSVLDALEWDMSQPNGCGATVFSSDRSLDQGADNVDNATGLDVESEALSTVLASAGALAREFRGDFGSRGGSLLAEGPAAEESQQSGPQSAVAPSHLPTLRESDTETQDSRLSLGDAIEFDMSRGDSDEESGPFGSERSEAEMEESIAGEEAAPVLDEEFEDVPDPRVAVLRVAFPMMDEVDPCNQFRQRCSQIPARSLQERVEGCYVIASPSRLEAKCPNQSSGPGSSRSLEAIGSV